MTDADFTEADLKTADFRNYSIKKTTQLISTCWRDTKNLDRLRPGTSYLGDAEVRELVRTGKGQKGNFERLDELRGINLKEADLTDASFIGSDLSRANLQGTDLSRAKLVQTLLEGADLTGATLTGAYIQDWGISSTTKINSINCDYVYLKLPTNEKSDPDRRPSDQARNFEPGEFASLVGIAANTVDLVFEHGIDWKAFLPTLQDLQVKYQEEDLSIAAIEKKPDGAFVVRLNVSPFADKGEIESQAKEIYEIKLSALEAQYRAELQAKDREIEIYKQQNVNMTNIVYTLANRPINVTSTAVSKSKAMNESIDKSRNLQVGDVGGDFKPIGSPIMSDNVEISGTVADSINQLPSSSDPNQPGIKELLAQLKDAIADSKELDDEDKAEALEQVKTLAEVGKNPTDEGSKKVAKTAMKILKGTAAMLPAGAALVTICKELLPAIAKLFGL